MYLRLIKISFNTSYLTDPYIVFTLKMESVLIQKYNFWPKNDGEKWSRKIFLNFHHAGDYFPLLHKIAQNHKFSNKNNYIDFKLIEQTTAGL